MFASAIVALGRVSFGIFIGEHTTCGFDDSGQREVFRGDQFDVCALSLLLVFEDGMDGGIELRKWAVVQGFGKSGFGYGGGTH
jgi:hypothetical protein